MTLDTANFFFFFWPSKPANVYGLFIVRFCTSWSTFRQITSEAGRSGFSKSNFSICKRRTTTNCKRSTQNSTTPLKKWHSVFSGSELPPCRFSLQLTLTFLYPRKPQSRSPSALGTVQRHILQHHAGELRQQLYFCPFNEKQDLLIAVYSQCKALHMSNITQ